MRKDRFNIGDVIYWKSGNHYYKHHQGKTKRIVQGEYENAKNIHICKQCGTEIYSVKEEFKCTKCGCVNKESEEHG